MIRSLLNACAVLALLVLTAACGGNSSSSSSDTGTILGIATPSSISVVSANNAD